MKKSLFKKVIGTPALLLLVGCAVMTPPAVPDDNAPAVPEPLAYYGDIELFKENPVPLAVMVSAPAASEEVSLVDTLKNAMNGSDIKCVLPGSPFDIQVSINSIYKELTPAPQCRLNHMLEISVANADGVKVLPLWQHKTEALKSCATAAEAKALMRTQINESIREWNRNYFIKKTKKLFYFL